MRQFFILLIEFMATKLIFTGKKSKPGPVTKKLYTIATVLPTSSLPINTLIFINL